MFKRVLSIATFWCAFSIGCERADIRPDGHLTHQHVDSLKERCEQGHATSCYMLGFIYQHGQGVTESSISSKAYYRQACKLGLKEACKDPNTQPQNPPLIAELSEADKRLTESCDSGQRASCEQLSDRAVRYAKDDGNVALAKTLWFHACKQKVANACLYLGIVYETEDPTLALQALDAACESGSGAGCNRLGQILAQSNDKDSKALAVEKFAKACTAGDEEGCATMAEVFRVLCDQANNGDSCAGYAALLLKGKGVKADFSRSKQYARKACRLGSQLGCNLEGFAP